MPLERTEINLEISNRKIDRKPPNICGASKTHRIQVSREILKMIVNKTKTQY